MDELKKYKLVKVIWTDILTDPSWTDIEDLDEEIKKAENAIYYSVGYLIRETKKSIVIAFDLSYLDNTQIAYTIIPRGVINKIENL